MLYAGLVIESDHSPEANASDAPSPLNPWNAALRFMLELWALFAMGYGSRALTSGWLKPVTMLAVPLTAAVLWGTFTVPGDPSRGKTGPVPVSGRVRLAIELGFFCLACWLLLESVHAAAAFALGSLVLVHYAVSHKRTRWLLRQPRTRGPMFPD